jgi:hypothetical protein
VEIKTQIPPITAMATPAVRMAVITAETGEVQEGDEDFGGWTIFTRVCPVLALHYFGAESLMDTDWYAAVFMTEYGMISNTRYLHDRCDAEVACCTWPPREDKRRLKDVAQELVRRRRRHIEELMAVGEAPYHDISIERGETPAPWQHRRDGSGEMNGAE